jgi:hypothetical protein
VTLRLRRHREQDEASVPEPGPEPLGEREERAGALPPPPLVTVGPLSEPSAKPASEGESSNES